MEGDAAQVSGRAESARVDVYDLFRRGSELLESGDYSAAAIPLEKASRFEPDKTSIREALGRAYFRSGRYAQGERGVRGRRRARAGERLRALLPRAARSRRPGGRTRRAATWRSRANLRPDRADYRAYRDRLRGQRGLSAVSAAGP